MDAEREMGDWWAAGADEMADEAEERRWRDNLRQLEDAAEADGTKLSLLERRMLELAARCDSADVAKWAEEIRARHA
jgi:hypothetical protein